MPTLPQWAEVVNVGLGLFGEGGRSPRDTRWRSWTGGSPPVATWTWSPPSGGSTAQAVRPPSDRPNAEVLRRLDEATPQLVAVAPGT